MKQSKKGFTLLEMMLVVGMVVLLSGVTLATASDLIQKSKNQSQVVEQHTMLIDQANKNTYNILANPREARMPAVDVSTNHEVNPGHNNNGGTNNGNHNGDTNEHSNNGGTNNGHQNDVTNTNTNTNDNTNSNTNTNTNTNTNDNTNSNTNTNDNTSTNTNTNSSNANENESTATSDQSGHSVIRHNNNGGTLTITADNDRRIESVTITIVRGNDSQFTNVNSLNNGRYNATISEDGRSIVVERASHDSWCESYNSINLGSIQWNTRGNMNVTYDIVYDITYSN